MKSRYYVRLYLIVTIYKLSCALNVYRLKSRGDIFWDSLYRKIILLNMINRTLPSSIRKRIISSKKTAFHHTGKFWLHVRGIFCHLTLATLHVRAIYNMSGLAFRSADNSCFNIDHSAYHKNRIQIIVYYLALIRGGL